MSPGRQAPPPSCAVCGADIPRHARACPECGADERTGWREQSIYDGLDLPDEALPSPPRRDGLPWYWLVAGVATVVAIILFALGGR